MKAKHNSLPMNQEELSMKKDMYRLLQLVSLVVLLLVVSVLLISRVLAAPAEIVTLSAVQDVYTDINAATTNFDEGLLTAANSPGPPGEDDVTTKQIFIQFDLSSLDFEITTASLSLSSLTCGGLVPVDVVDIVVFGVDNSSTWDQTTLIWEKQPALSTQPLATLDSGSTSFNSNQIYTWTDDQKGDLATWLESQRTSGNKTSTLVLQIDNSENPGMADVFFEDSEGTGTAYGCTDELTTPNLTVSNAIIGYKVFMPFISR